MTSALPSEAKNSVSKLEGWAIRTSSSAESRLRTSIVQRLGPMPVWVGSDGELVAEEAPIPPRFVSRRNRP